MKAEGAEESAKVLSLPNGPSGGFRMMSLDVLRGFAMFWVVLGNLVLDPDKFVADSRTVRSLATLLGHCDWDGFGAADLVFPLFVFIAGMSIPFSIRRLIEHQGLLAAYRRIFRRAILLYLIGVFYKGGIAHAWPDVALVGVLQRIALCYLIAGLLFCHLRTRGLVAVFVTILVAYWALLSFVPAPGVGAPSFAKGANWANYIDRHYLPGAKAYGDWDPEGLLGTIPAAATCVLGILVAGFMSLPLAPKRKVLYLTAGGLAGILLGFLWGLWFPLIKKIWTSSFVLESGGFSCLFLAIFYLVVDVWQLRSWTPLFIWLGKNPLAMYLSIEIVDFRGLAQRLVGGDVFAVLGSYGNLAVTIVSVASVCLLARFMHRKGIFLRL
jgi:predicted acyltransferase